MTNHSKRILVIISSVIAILALVIIVISFISGRIVSSIIREDIQQSLNNAKRVDANISIGDIDYSLIQDRTIISNIKIAILSDNDISRDYWSFKIPSVKTSGFSLIKWMMNKCLQFENVNIKIEDIKYSSEYKMDNKTEENIKVNWRKRISAIFPDNFSAIKVQKLRIDIENIIRDIYPMGDISYTDSIQKSYININDFDYVKSYKNKLRTGPLSIYSNNYSRRFSEDFMVLRIRKIKGLSKYSYFLFKDVSYEPYVSNDLLDERFQYQKNIYKIKSPKIEIKGFNFKKLIDENSIKCDELQIGSFDFDVLINKKKEANHSDTSMYPNLIIRNIPYNISINSIHLYSGRIVYREIHPLVENPAFIELTKFEAHSGKINTKAPINYVTNIHIEGNIMDESKLELDLSLPLTSNNYVANYSGSLHSIDLTEFNNFLEASEFIKINSGYLNEVNFSATIKDGMAQGKVYADYSHLNVTQKQFDPETENYFTNMAFSYIFNTVVIKKDNTIGSADYKTGDIYYFIKPEDSFLQTLWFPVKQGIGKIAGFE